MTARPRLAFGPMHPSVVALAFEFKTFKLVLGPPAVDQHFEAGVLHQHHYGHID